MEKEMMMQFLDKVQQLQRTTMGCNCMTITTRGFNETIGIDVFWHGEDDSCELFRVSDYNTEEELKDELARLTELIRKSGWL